MHFILCTRREKIEVKEDKSAHFLSTFKHNGKRKKIEDSKNEATKGPRQQKQKSTEYG